MSFQGIRRNNDWSGDQMADTKKCENPPCSCVPPACESFCSPHCEGNDGNHMPMGTFVLPRRGYQRSVYVEGRRSRPVTLRWITVNWLPMLPRLVENTSRNTEPPAQIYPAAQMDVRECVTVCVRRCESGMTSCWRERTGHRPYAIRNPVGGRRDDLGGNQLYRRGPSL